MAVDCPPDVEVADEQAAATAVGVRVDDLAVLLRRVPGGARGDNLRDPPARDHGVHRAVGLRQDHGAALLQPDERHSSRLPASRARSTTTASISTAPNVSATRCAATSAWCSRSRTRSRRASTTTSPTARRSRHPQKSELDDVVEESLRGAALWDEVKDRLEELGARPVGRSAAAAVHRPGARRGAGGDPDGRAVLGARSDRHRADRGPDAGDQARYTIIIVTHNMQQAARVSDRTAFFTTEVDSTATAAPGCSSSSTRHQKIFSNPSDERTEAYVTGRFG